MGLKGLDLGRSCAKVKNRFGLGLEGWRGEAKEQGVGVSWVFGRSMEVDGLVWNKRLYVGTVVGG